MRKLNLIILLLLINYSTSTETINLTTTNLVVLRGEVNGPSVSKWVIELLQIQDDTIYVYIITNGGSVEDGVKVIEVINTLQENNKNVVCIADVAMSMGFIILQSCPVRYIMSSSILMQHQLSLGASGSIRNVQTRIKYIEYLENDLNEMQANRLGINIDSFLNFIAHDWWLYGKNILKFNAADKMVHVLCSEDLVKLNVTETIKTHEGDITLIYSGCPLAKDPLMDNI
jgi:ATP-dependent protease ClpP protease subunit